MKLLNLFKPKPTALNIDAYGEPSIEPDQTQALMEWLFASLMNAGYFGKSHFIWYDSDNPDPNIYLQRVPGQRVSRQIPSMSTLGTSK